MRRQFVDRGVVACGQFEIFGRAVLPGPAGGAPAGQGLGLRFLRHLSRTALLIHIVDAGGLSGRDPMQDFEVVNEELRRFDPALASRPQIVAANKIDLVGPDALGETTEAFRQHGVDLRLISAATGQGVRELINEAGQRALEARTSATRGNKETEEAGGG